MKKKKSDIFVHAESALMEDFNSAIVMDDDEALCRMVCKSVADQLKNTVVLGFIHPEDGLEIMDHLYFDLLISDINMPDMCGDKVIAHVKTASPTTFTIAMTGFGAETAYTAGKAQPDFFFDKSRGVDSLLGSLKEGFEEAGRRRKMIFKKYLDKSGEISPMGRRHWRQRSGLTTLLGFSLRDYFLSKKNVKALALLKLIKNVTFEEFTILSGHSSSQRLKQNMAILSRFVNLPER